MRPTDSLHSNHKRHDGHRRQRNDVEDLATDDGGAEDLDADAAPEDEDLDDEQ
jgi:hypothetical protein